MASPAPPTSEGVQTPRLAPDPADPTSSKASPRAQAARIIELLERPLTTRVRIASQASQAHGVLAVLTALSLVAGIVLGLVGLVVMASEGFLYGLTFILITAAYAGLSWGLLTTASVVAGYVANRSE